MARSLLPVLLLVPVPFASASAQAPEGRAVYEVRFDATWSQATHPGAYPANAHFSPLVGATHQEGAGFWEPGGLATVGIERMAESGSTSFLFDEFGDAIQAGTAEAGFASAGIGSPGSTSHTFEVSPAFPAVTLVTMIAPSPDWFVGVDGLLLFENGAWVEERVVPLYAWDAGTDSGTSFTAGNFNTVPQEEITRITTANGGPFTGADPLGTFTFRRLRSGVELAPCSNPSGSLTVSAPPRVGSSLAFTVSDPGGTMPVPSLAYLGFSLEAAPACGTRIDGWGLTAPGAAGDFALRGPTQTYALAPWSGNGSSFTLPIPADASLVGLTFHAQGALVDPGARVGLTTAWRLVIGA